MNNQQNDDPDEKDEDLEARLAALAEASQVGIEDNGNGTFTLSISLQQAQEYLTANGGSITQDEMAEQISNEIFDITQALKVIKFLALYLVIKKIVKENIIVSSQAQAIALFNEQGFLFSGSLEELTAEPETAEEVADRRQRFTSFVTDLNYTIYGRLNTLYKRYDQSINGLFVTVEQDYSSFADFLNQNRQQVQNFLTELCACFSEDNLGSLDREQNAIFVSAEETEEGRSVLITAEEQQQLKPDIKAISAAEEKIELTERLVPVLEKFFEHLRRLELGISYTRLSFVKKHGRVRHEDEEESGPKKYPRCDRSNI